MFFSWRKKSKSKESPKEEQQQIQGESISNSKEVADAYAINLDIFYEICDMVRNRPKERQIVVVQRKNIFKDEFDKNWFYKQLALEMFQKYQEYGQRWMCDYDDSLYAFYTPRKLNKHFKKAIEELSKDGYIMHQIQYYHFDY